MWVKLHRLEMFHIAGIVAGKQQAKLMSRYLHTQQNMLILLQDLDKSCACAQFACLCSRLGQLDTNDHQLTKNIKA